MLKRINIYHTIIFLFIVILGFRYEVLFNGTKLLIYFLFELLNNSDNIISKIDLLTIDLFTSIILFFIILIIILKYHNQNKIFLHKIELSTFIFILLLFAVLFAPIVTNYHPNAQNNIRATRFLPPLSSVQIIDKSSIDNLKLNFELLQNKTINRETVSDKIYVNLSRTNDDIILQKKENITSPESLKSLLSSNNITSKMFLLGTDELGRDIFSRIIYGARVSLCIAISTVFISLLLGVLLGFIAAHHGGVLNLILSRTTDGFLTIPSIFFIIMILAFWGNSILTVILVLGGTGWVSIFKVVKGEVASIIEKDYFITSRKLGLSFWRLLFKEIFPVLIISLTVATVFQFSNVILAESALSYLGLGVGINYPSWGNMILAGQQYMGKAWWMLLIPSVTLVVLLVSINSFGEKIKKIINPTIVDD